MSGSLAAPDACMICFDKPDLYGLLQNCNHQFCYECIKEWRKTSKPQGVVRPALLHNIFSNNVTRTTELQARLEAARQASLRQLERQSRTLEASQWNAQPQEVTGIQHDALNEAVNYQTLEAWRRYADEEDYDSDDAMLEDDREISQHASGLGRDRKVCPFCSQPSLCVISAVSFPHSSEQKDQLCKGFYAEKKRILCRDFEANINAIEGYYCPRFNDCLYAHLKPVDSPNTVLRTEPFTFTPERIEQLKRRRAIDSAPHMRHGGSDIRDVLALGLPLHIRAAIVNMLGDAVLGQDYHVDLIMEFLETFQIRVSLIKSLFEELRTALSRFDDNDGDYLFQGLRGEPAWTTFIRMHDDNGHFLDQVAGTPVSLEAATRAGCRSVAMCKMVSGLPTWSAYHFVVPENGEDACGPAHVAFLESVKQENKESEALLSQLKSTPRCVHHLFSDMGHYEDSESDMGDAIYEHYPTYVEFDSMEESLAGVGAVTHRFWSPLSLEDANAIISLGPEFQGLLCAIKASCPGAPEFTNALQDTLLDICTHIEEAEMSTYEDMPYHGLHMHSWDGVEDDYHQAYTGEWMTLDEAFLDDSDEMAVDEGLDEEDDGEFYDTDDDDDDDDLEDGNA